MTEEKKEPITMEPPAENDPTADELVVIGLQKENNELQEQVEFLTYQNEALKDMARMNCASHTFAALLTWFSRDGVIDQLSMEQASDIAIEGADVLISQYQEIIEEKAAKFQQILGDQKMREEEDDETVN